MLTFILVTAYHPRRNRRRPAAGAAGTVGYLHRIYSGGVKEEGGAEGEAVR